MSRRMVSILAAAAAVFAVGAPTASAADAVALPYCWGATYGGSTAQLCAKNTSWVNGTVVDPGAQTDCIIKTDTVALAGAVIPPVYPCRIAGDVITGVDDTGAGPVRTTLPYLHQISVRMNANQWATFYVDGKTYSVFTDALCLGGGCPTNLAQLIQLVQVQ